MAIAILAMLKKLWFIDWLTDLLIDWLIELQLVVQLMFSSSRYDHITTLLANCTGWEHLIGFSSSLLFSCTSVCLHGTAPSYLTDELEYTADFKARRCLWSASSLSLNVRRTRLSTVGDRAFPVAAARTWNSLPQHVTSTPSMSVLRSPQGFPLQAFLPMTFTTTFVVPAQWQLSFLDTWIVLFLLTH